MFAEFQRYNPYNENERSQIEKRFENIDRVDDIAETTRNGTKRRKKQAANRWKPKWKW